MAAGNVTVTREEQVETAILKFELAVGFERDARRNFYSADAESEARLRDLMYKRQDELRDAREELRAVMQ